MRWTRGCCRALLPFEALNKRAAMQAELSPGQRRPDHVIGQLRLSELSRRRCPGRGMLLYRSLSVAMSVLLLLPGCTPMSLYPSDRAPVCRVDVNARLAQPMLVANPLSKESGVATGAAFGVLQGLLTGPAAIIGVPFYAILGSVAGAACADTASTHPSADADFERILGTADIGVLKQAVERELASPRPECQPAKADTPPATQPDAVVEIEKVELRMGCLFGKQSYSIEVH